MPMHFVGTLPDTKGKALPPGLENCGKNAGRQLLVVQGNGLARNALVRFFSSMVDVASFESPAPAEKHIQTVSQTLYILLGQWFVHSKPGSEWVKRWRKQYPGIQRVVLATGLDGVAPAIDGVDAIVSKPFDVRLITKLLTLDEPAAWEPASIHQKRIPI